MRALEPGASRGIVATNAFRRVRGRNERTAIAAYAVFSPRT